MTRRNRPKSQIAKTPAHPSQASITQVQAEYYFAGPLPHPGLLAKYNEVIPHGAERIMAMAERQSAHRESLESQVVAGNLAAQRQGARYGFILAMATILGGLILIYHGNDVSGLTTILGSLAGLVGIFFYSSQQQKKERAEKSTTLAERRHR